MVAADGKSLFGLVSRTAHPTCQEFGTLLQTKLVKLKLELQFAGFRPRRKNTDSFARITDTSILREVLKVGR